MSVGWPTPTCNSTKSLVEPKVKKLVFSGSTCAGLRLDRALALQAEIGSRTQGASLIGAHRVLVNGQKAKPSLILQPNDIIEVSLPETDLSQSLVPYPLKLDIVFEDESLLVVNKPAGLVVHPSVGHPQETLVNALIAHTSELSMGFHEVRPGIVHRIDRDTSGLLVVAKNDRSHRHLAEQFQQKTTHRIYWAIVHGSPKNDIGRYESYLARHPNERKKFASVRDRQGAILRDPAAPPAIGKWAVTTFQVKFRSNKGLSLLELKLETGRTHQIRVHLSEAGVPIVGDKLYGPRSPLKHVESLPLRTLIKNMPRFALHAAELGFVHPMTGASMLFKVDWPKDLKELLQVGGLHH